METKLNIAEILKDKPKGAKLYTDVFGKLSIKDIDVESEPSITLLDKGGYISYFYGNGKYSLYGEPILFPSKEMQDWSKFAWKKGDVLVSKGRRTLHVIFEGFNDDTYTTFKGKHYLCDYSDKEDYDEEYYNDYHKEVNERTIEFEKDNVNNAQTYINIIEKRLGGKLNRETLEIEKTQPEFKDGDIVFVRCKRYCFIEIFNYFKNDDLNDYASLNTTLQTVDIGGEYPIFKDEIVEIRLATNSEKKQLFDALAKEGKAWDAEKKEVIDLKPKVEFEPFDKVLVRDCLDEIWRPSFFARYLPSGREPYQVIGGERVKLCIPYEGNESLLGTTKGVEG